MNRDLALTDGDRSWPVGPTAPRSGEVGPEQQAQAPVLDLSTFFRILREWRWLIVGAVALGLALAMAVTLLTTPMYRAWVTLEVNPPTVEILNEEQERAATPNLWDFVSTQVGLLSSRTLAERVAQDLNLANNPAVVDQSADPATRVRVAAARVSGGLNVVAPEEGQLIQFNYVSESPQLAAQVANGVAEAFINTSLQRRYEASAYARNFLERQIAKTRGDLERSERQLVAYAQAEGIINTSTGEGAPSGDASSLQGESLIALNRALAEATARRVAAEGAYRQASSVGATSEVAESTQALRQSRAALEAEYQDKRTLMKPEHPEMVSLRSRIDELDRQIAREGANVTSSRSNSLLAEYRGALAAERALQARVQQLKGAVLDLRGRSIRYTILQREVDTNRALYEALLQRYKEVGVAGGIGTAPVTIVDRAEVPGAPYKPNLMFNLLAGLLLGFLSGVLAAVALEFLNDTIKTRADVRRKLGLPCLGAVPKRKGRQGFIEDLQDPTSALSEAYSTIAASLQFSTEKGVPKALLISSAKSSEGKSTSALALAQNFARRGKSVLLIDGDLRKPAFKTSSSERGLTKLLTNEDSVAGHIIPTQYENLSLLPAGPIPPNPADLLSSGRFRSILAEASGMFDLVVIDAPPVVGLADAALLASACPDVILVVESGKTRTSAAQEAMNRLRNSGARILGVTLTKSSEEASSYGYGYGYGYGKHRYGSLEKDRNRTIMITHQAES